MQDELLAAELAHEALLLLDDNDLAVIDDAYPVSQLLGLFDVMRRQDNGHPGFAQPLDDIP